MHQNSPYWEPKSKIILGGEEDTPPHTEGAFEMSRKRNKLLPLRCLCPPLRTFGASILAPAALDLGACGASSSHHLYSCKLTLKKPWEDHPTQCVQPLPRVMLALVRSSWNVLCHVFFGRPLLRLPSSKKRTSKEDMAQNIPGRPDGSVLDKTWILVRFVVAGFGFFPISMCIRVATCELFNTGRNTASSTESTNFATVGTIKRWIEQKFFFQCYI